MKVPQGWGIKKIGDICKHFKGFAFKTIDYANNGVRIIRVSDMGYGTIKNKEDCIYLSQEHAGLYGKWALKDNDLIVTTVGSRPPIYNSLVGRTIIVKKEHEKCLLNQNAVCLRADNNWVQQEYLNQLLKRKRYVYYVESIIRGNANQASITLEDLFKFKVFLPPLSEQKKIAGILSCWDEVIEKIENLITAKKTFKKGVMQKLLSGAVRFKGFNGKAELKKLKGMVKDISVRNKDSSTSVVLSVTNTNGFVVQTEHFDKSVASEDISNYKIVKKGQFGYNPSRVNVGSIAMLEKDIEGALSPMYVIFETVDGVILPDYMKQFIKSSWFNGHVRCLTQGSVRDSLSFDALEQIKIFVPTIEEQKRIAEALSSVDKEISLLEKKRDALKKQKKGLMQKLLTGKIRVKA